MTTWRMVTRMRRVSSLSTLGEIDVLSVDECHEVANRVLDLRDDWTARSPSGLFATLGVNAYMDLAHSADPDGSYFHPAHRTNALLRRHFADVHSRFLRVLGEEVGMPAAYADDLALPGFHIWVGRAIPCTAAGSTHFDLQYERLLTRPRYADATGTMSFTVPIKMPVAGSSLHVWPRCGYPQDMPRLAEAKQADPEVVGYHLGCAIVHTGHVMHQIGAVPSVQPDDVRITMQGHGLVVDGVLVLYW